MIEKRIHISRPLVSPDLAKFNKVAKMNITFRRIPGN